MEEETKSPNGALDVPIVGRVGGVDQIIRHADTRLALWAAKRHQQHRRYGWQTLAASPDRMGLISLNGTIVAPRPNRPWRPER